MSRTTDDSIPALGHRRHTAAFNLIGTGVPLNQVQGILGHANISTTSLYIKARGAELRSTIEAVAVPTALSRPTELV
ncbi:MAG: tyrosine-type recombinase/integrase [Actinomycetota bacterium]|nr:tyrosine-type recombinase/integrase [Actinomycetota bacterium]